MSLPVFMLCFVRREYFQEEKLIVPNTHFVALGLKMCVKRFVQEYRGKRQTGNLDLPGASEARVKNDHKIFCRESALKSTSKHNLQQRIVRVFGVLFFHKLQTCWVLRNWMHAECDDARVEREFRPGNWETPSYNGSRCFSLRRKEFVH